MSEWKKIGVIGVDAGLCWVGDPCYIFHHEDSTMKEALGRDWQDFCDKVSEGGYSSHKQFNYPMGHPGLGVTVSTGYGDGCYDVFVKHNNEGRIAELKVVFIK